MPKVNTTHPCYTEHVNGWRKCRDCVEGSEQIKAEGTAYLAMLDGQSEGEYAAYKDRALFYGATGRTVAGLTGAVTRKPPEINFPESGDEMLQHLGGANVDLSALGKEVLSELITTGRLGLYVDAPSLPDADPRIYLYYAENIINWRVQEIDGQDVLTMVVLKEEVENPDRESVFDTSCIEQYRVLMLNVTDQGRQYSVQVWREKEGSGGGEEDFYLVEEVFPTMKGGRPLEFIPFQFVRPLGLTPDVEPSPILDLVNVNLSHYKSSADLEHGRHFTALPTAWLAGFDKQQNYRLGSSEAWCTDDPSARAGFLEFTGQGLSSLEKALESKEKLMAVLGARMLEAPKNQAEAAAAIALRQSGEHSVLSNVATSASMGLSVALSWVADWAGMGVAKPEDASIAFNQEFTEFKLDAQLLAQLMASTQGGLISWDTFFYNVKRAELVPDNVDADEERNRIEAGVPMAPPKPGAPGDGQGDTTQGQGGEDTMMGDGGGDTMPGQDGEDTMMGDGGGDMMDE